MASSLMGIPFPTPFACPSGVGNSGPVVNFIWGFFNLVSGIYIITLHPFPMMLFDLEMIAFLGGVFAIGIYLSIHFGKVRHQTAQSSQ
ncbi:hypothetical protein PAPYR_12601 [Paratrimastix pyriformis]|uniref:Uncharacterized protein n=1 Tax=Paratrimastix pyriformis TaxID=342808 RepID=A0ABQ8U8A9_9EUKA|nr:hypothetical protein PAPYR_12601 [Paratrimastix pyriformis]